jgi:hypothetical protein
MSKYVLKNDHPLIPREQTFAIDRKLLTVHSEDRDINKWPNANHFELQLPQTYTNVETLALVEYNFPIYYNTFSTQNQNTIITVYVNILGGWGETQPPLTIIIEPGFYDPVQLAYEMENKLNLAVRALGDTSLIAYSNFKVFYDEVRQRLLFGNTSDPFTFIYNAPESYDSEPCYTSCPPANATQPGQPSAIIRWNQYTNWGLGYNLGFIKYQCVQCGSRATTQSANTAVASSVTGDQKVYYKPSATGGTNIGYTWLPVGSGNTGYVLIPPNPPSLNGDSAMYMELDKYNYQDEMQPYSEHTSNTRHNDYNGIVNAAFAKIPILSKPTKIISLLEYQYGNEPPDTAEGMSSFFPPLIKLSKFKFKFRYHDGTLVDFGGQNFSFTIALYCYRDEIARSKHLRIPYVSPGQ